MSQHGNKKKWEKVVKPGYIGYKSAAGLVEKYAKGRPWVLWVRRPDGALIQFITPLNCTKLSEAKREVSQRFRIEQDIRKGKAK